MTPIRMIRSAPILTSLVAIGCTSPDLRPGIKEATALLAETDNQIRPMLEPLAAAELAAAEEAAMQRGEIILMLEGSCNYADARDAGQARTDCALVEIARPDKGAVNATTMLDALDAMSAYFVALDALASSESADEVAARTAALMEALTQLDDTSRSPALARIAATAADHKDLVSRSSGFLANQYRIAALRRVVRRADPIFGQLVPIAAAYLDQAPDGMPIAQMRLEAAEENMTLASGAGSVARHRAAAAELRAAFAAFKIAEAKSPANRLILLRKFHADLLDRLTGPQSAEDLLTTIEDIKAIADLASQGGENGQ